MRTGLIAGLRLLPTERRFVARVIPLLLLIRIGLKLLPLARLRRLLAWTADRSHRFRWAGDLAPERVAGLVASVSGRLLKDRPCLVQALGVEWLFRVQGLPATLVIGVAKRDERGLVAHAWVESDGKVIIGGSEADLAVYRRLPALDGERL